MQTNNVAGAVPTEFNEMVQQILNCKEVDGNIITNDGKGINLCNYKNPLAIISCLTNVTTTKSGKFKFNIFKYDPVNKLMKDNANIIWSVETLEQLLDALDSSLSNSPRDFIPVILNSNDSRLEFLKPLFFDYVTDAKGAHFLGCELTHTGTLTISHLSWKVSNFEQFVNALYQALEIGILKTYLTEYTNDSWIDCKIKSPFEFGFKFDGMKVKVKEDADNKCFLKVITKRNGDKIKWSIPKDTPLNDMFK